MSVALYNDTDRFVCGWLENLIRAGHVANGVVDRRSIADLKPDDVAGCGQRHFFAGIGGWSHALRIAGVPDDASIWTGSPPCQPFSGTGARRGTRDPRHLWPAWRSLVEEHQPPIIFGEQVSSRDGLAWFDVVSTDLERCGYAIGAADLCAASVGAPHIRQRLYFVAYTDRFRCESWPTRWLHGSRESRPIANGCGPSGMLGNAGSNGDREYAGQLHSDETQHAIGPENGDHAPIAASSISNPWERCEWIQCTDGTTRPIEPGAFPLANGIPGRMGRLRAYGNAIVPQLAATFIRCAIEAIWGG